LTDGADLGTTPREGDEQQHYGATSTSPTDILMTVGSASSLSSVASSVFSNHFFATPTTDSRYNMSNLTPLTNNTESSPPGKMLSPHSHKRSYEQMHNGGITNTHTHSHSPYLALTAGGSNACSRAASEAITPVQTPPDSGQQPRPSGPGEVTAVKILYDPEQDKSLDTKQRRQMKPTYRTLTTEVRPTSMQGGDFLMT
jgi:histone-lysine N-methyltransferase SETD1